VSKQEEEEGVPIGKQRKGRERTPRSKNVGLSGPWFQNLKKGKRGEKNKPGTDSG